jgi:monoterpene epsilon-lactone hydrolase
MTSELLNQVISGMPADFADPRDDYLKTREKFAPLHSQPLKPDTSVRISEVGGVRVGWLTSSSSDPDRGAVLFFHGGAFVSCDLAAYLFYAEFIADGVGVPVLTVDYRLAPEHPYPAALDDCMAAYEGLLDQGQAPDRLVFVGDSCGGGLALATLLRARDGGLPLPAGLVCLSGWIDLDTCGYGPDGPHTPDPFISEGFLRARASDYLGAGGDPHGAWASPGRAALDGLPPLLFQVGETDVCRLDAERASGRARDAGVDAQLDVVAGGVHGIQGLVSLGVPEAVAAWQSVRRFTDGCLPR